MSSAVREHDTVIIGGGHNGLVAAFYLARAGRRPLVLERRPVVGGCAVTEEFAPGFFASPGAYVVSMLRDHVWRDLRLVERGVTVDECGPTFHAYEDGKWLWVPDDPGAVEAEFARYSTRDAGNYRRFVADLEAMAQVLEPLFDITPVDPTTIRRRDVRTYLKLANHLRAHRRQIRPLLRLMSTSARHFLEGYFETDEIKTAFAWHALNDNWLGPSSPGTAYVLIHDAVSVDDNHGGGPRPWGFVRGGIGRLPEAMAEAVVEAGGAIRTGAEVAEIVVRGGRAGGVRLADGELIEAPLVLSNADPKRTFGQLVDPAHLPAAFVEQIAQFRANGTSIKINLALEGLPRHVAHPTNDGDRDVQEYHRGMLEYHPSLADMDRSAHNVLSGRPTLERMNIEACFPSVFDPSLAPAGHHVMTIDSNGQPYHLAEGHWDDLIDTVADAVIARLAVIFPDLPARIRHRRVLSPLDMERVLGITGGHALHGDMNPDQLFFFRPASGFADYRTPIQGLWLCGAGTHPGGGVTGANGSNCAREILRGKA